MRIVLKHRWRAVLFWRQTMLKNDNFFWLLVDTGGKDNNDENDLGAFEAR